MGTVTAYNMASIQSALGGSNPISLSEYYRGGAYVPTTRSTTVRDPTSGEYWNSVNNWWWEVYDSVVTFRVYWNRTNLGFQTPGSATSWSNGGYIYYRGSLRSTYYPPYSPPTFYYGVYRTYSSSVSINTGVPSSGSISISQLYGAANP